MTIHPKLAGRSCYHKYEVQHGLFTPGQFLEVNPKLCLDELGIPESLSGLRALDIGAWDGPFTFELERRGAHVTALDTQDPDITVFNAVKEIKKSSAVHVRGSIYDAVPETLGTYDTVLFAGVYYHLQSPVLALQRIRNLLTDKGVLFIEGASATDYLAEQISKTLPELEMLTMAEILDRLPLSYFDIDNGIYNAGENFCFPTTRGLKAILLTSGFRNIACELKLNAFYNYSHRRLMARAEVDPEKSELANRKDEQWVMEQDFPIISERLSHENHEVGESGADVDEPPNPRLIECSRSKRQRGATIAASLEVKEDLERARAAWAGIMEKYKNDVGVVDFTWILGDYPMLGNEHIENCRMFSSREKLILEMKKGGHVAEVGVQKGAFSRYILENNFPAKLHLFDVNFKTFTVAEYFAEQIKAGQVILHEGDSSTELSKLPDRYFDFIYIGGDHSYTGVQQDIAAAKTRIKEDGYLIFNDYTFWSPVECIPYGVVKAVNELCLKEGWKLEYFALGWFMYCDVAVRKSRSTMRQSGESRTTNYNGLDLACCEETPHLGGSIKFGDPFTCCPTVWDYIIDRFAIESVLDLGSGCGNASHYFFRKGLKVVAIEGFIPSVLASSYPAVHHDLTRGAVSTHVDLVHCHEVVEHIEDQYVENVVASLLTGKIILMTHALPGQAGYHHVNLQPPEYWIQKLEAKGGRLLQEDTDRVRKLAAADGAIYMQNTGLVFANSRRV